MVVLFQGVARNIYLGRLSCFIVLKALNSESIMQVVSAVSLFQHKLVKMILAQILYKKIIALRVKLPMH